ncbi:DUF2809 domain-containing protein [Pseudonocardia sp. GCM10023141]|uniref:ribosomal maturation YjgA family protein n=1 Tax=Pseudonocardia sp. GCM10023141 TaxID=3252653 RepID=UPI00361695C8
MVPRRRAVVLLVLVAVIAVGLVLQLFRASPLADHAGNVLYAGAVYLGVCLLAPGARWTRVAAVALLLCVAVEVLQLTPVPGAVAAVVPGARLVLGSTFVWTDFLGYAVGVALAAALDARTARLRAASPAG